MEHCKRVILLTTLSLLLAGYTFGQERKPMDGPPPEAYKACEGREAGSPARLTAPNGEKVVGTCQEKNGKLVLVPSESRGEHGENRKTPPPEAFRACEGKQTGTKAELKGPRGETVTGICEEKDGKLVLRPDRPPR